MTMELPPVRASAVHAAVHGAYRAAGLVAGETESVVPLRRLIAAQPLVVEEVSGLTRRIAEQHLATRAGRDLLKQRGSDERLAGFIHVTPVGGWILINRDDPLARRRFSIAHELGHYLLHFTPLLGRVRVEGLHEQNADDPDELALDEELQTPGDDAPDVQSTVTQLSLYQVPGADLPDVARLEAEANLFAAEILAPEETCRRLVAKHGRGWGIKRDVLARRLAGECLISQQAMERRLSALGLP